MTSLNTQIAEGELLYGVRAIAAFLGCNCRQAAYLIERKAFPCWREGRTILVSRAAVRGWIASRQAAAGEALQ